MRESEPTPDELRFFSQLSTRVEGVQDWYHQDADGTPWMTASYDYVNQGTVFATLRVDYDGSRLAGGWSPACLNWDDGVRADEAHIEVDPPEGIDCPVSSPDEAAALAMEWFLRHPGPRRAGR